jgi:hypothetical protein
MMGVMRPQSCHRLGFAHLSEIIIRSSSSWFVTVTLLIVAIYVRPCYTWPVMSFTRQAAVVARLLWRQAGAGYWLRSAPALLVVVNLSLLSPLACLLHCYFLARSAEAAQTAGAGWGQFYLCHLATDSESPDAPPPIEQRSPRAFYELAPALTSLILTPSLLAFPYWPSVRRLRPQTSIAPLMPPPRFAAA